MHTHGNCSWSGVYIVQADADPVRSAHPVYGALNGVTRFYGPHFGHLGGAHVDVSRIVMVGAIVALIVWETIQGIKYKEPA